MAKILLVEDDNNLREIYEARLQAEGYEIVSAQDGEEALVVAKNEKPDLVISDVMMPKISGFEMLDILRNTEGLKDVKVIMLTALGQSDDQKRADKLGADRYLVKSQVTLEDIVKVTHEILGTPDGSAPAASPTPLSTPPTQAAAPQADSTVPVTVSQPAPQPTQTLAAATAASNLATDDKLMDEAVNSLTASADDSAKLASAPVDDDQSVTSEPVASDPVTPTPQTPVPVTESDITLPLKAPEPTATPSIVMNSDHPDLADSTKDEETKVESQIEDFANSATSNPVEAAPATPAPQPETPTTPASPTSPSIGTVSSAVQPHPSESSDDKEEKPSDEATEPLIMPGTAKKIIEPIDTEANKPDINALLAQEEAKEVSAASPGVTLPDLQPAPTSPTVVNVPVVTPEVPPTPDGGTDPNSIAL